MAEIIITIKDHDNGYGFNFDMDSNPGIPMKEPEKMTPAQAFAANIMNMVTELQEAIKDEEGDSDEHTN